MGLITVGISDCRVSNVPGDVLVTYALGSCIAVAVHDPAAGVGGLAHYLLPDSSIDSPRSRQNPYTFADTAIPLLLGQVRGLGGDQRRLSVRVAGGAQVINDGGVFEIGKRNYLAFRKTIWKHGGLIHGERVGGSVSRTVRLEVGTGKLWIREGSLPEFELAPRWSPAKELGDNVPRISSR
jgi:chemotaxis protein CheD